ncbi:MAG: hypothetical protein HY791_00645 [Deltaproteobacteria bacterium]|nr:hypothetical protein [Deltaproteobacteria bacterium]
MSRESFGPFEILDGWHCFGEVELRVGHARARPLEPLVLYRSLDSATGSDLISTAQGWASLQGLRLPKLVATGRLNQWSYAAFRCPAAARLDELVYDWARVDRALSVDEALSLTLDVAVLAQRVLRAQADAQVSPSLGPIVSSFTVGLGPDGSTSLLEFPVLQTWLKFSVVDLRVSRFVWPEASPEETIGKYAGEKSEVYRVGTLLYLLLKRGPIYPSEGDFELVARRIRDGRFAPLTDELELPPTLLEVANCSLSAPVDARPDLSVLIDLLRSARRGPAEAARAAVGAAVRDSTPWREWERGMARMGIPVELALEPDRYADAVYLPKLGLVADRRPVSMAEYARFLGATDRIAPPNWPDGLVPAGREEQSVTLVRQGEALDYARFRGGRLPTADELMEITRSVQASGGVAEWTASPWEQSHFKVVRLPGGELSHAEDRREDLGFRVVYGVSAVPEVSEGTVEGILSRSTIPASEAPTGAASPTAGPSPDVAQTEPFQPAIDEP